ncbi:MAG: FKBP-type peptidyl-prolyl cis-trans isomerase [Pseudomonadota bacterium]
MTKTPLLVTVAAGVLALAACSETSTTEATAPTSTETPPKAQEGALVPAAFANPDLPSASGTEFLTALAERANTQTTETGLVLETIREGSGPMPGANDIVRMHFIARVAGETEPFESTYKSGNSVVFTAGETLPGWAEALQLTKEGSLVRAAIPPELAFGAEGMQGGPVGPNAVTVFDVELINVYDIEDNEALAELASASEERIVELSEDAQRYQTLAQQEFAALSLANLGLSNIFLAAQEEREGVMKTESGLLYEVITDGGADKTPSAEDTVTVNYEGKLPDGQVFDSSYQRGEPASFPLNGVIAGWTEGVQLMNPGDKYRFFIPPNLAYGQQGSRGLIGPNQALAFDVELISVGAPEPAEEAAQE